MTCPACDNHCSEESYKVLGDITKLVWRCTKCRARYISITPTTASRTPLAASEPKSNRNEEIIKRCLAGESKTRLASEYGITRARVYQILKREEAAHGG